MNINSHPELEASREKLRAMEELYARKQTESAEDPHLREWTLHSLKQLINQFREEIIRFECRAGRRGNGTGMTGRVESSRETNPSGSQSSLPT